MKNNKNFAKFVYKYKEGMSYWVIAGVVDPNVQKILKGINTIAKDNSLDRGDLLKKVQEVIFSEIINDNKEVKEFIFPAIDVFFRNFINHKKYSRYNKEENKKEFIKVGEDLKDVLSNYEGSLKSLLSNILKDQVLSITENSKYIGHVFCARWSLGKKYYNDHLGGHHLSRLSLTEDKNLKVLKKILEYEDDGEEMKYIIDVLKNFVKENKNKNSAKF